MKVRLQLQTTEITGAEILFDTIERQWPSLRSIGFSLGTHLAIVWLLASISFPQTREVAKRQAEPDPTQIRIGDRLYYVARIPPPERGKSPAPQARPAKRSPAPPAAEAKKTAPPPRPFIPPEFKRNPVAQETLIQPDSPPNLQPPPADLPSFRIWSAEVPKIPKPFVAPGRHVTTPEQPQLLAEPSFDLTRPARQANLTPHLTVPPAPAPLDLPPAPEIPQLTAGDPVNIVSITDRPALPVDLLKVPAGNVVAESDSHSNGAVGKAPAVPDPASASAGASSTATEVKATPGTSATGVAAAAEKESAIKPVAASAAPAGSDGSSAARSGADESSNGSGSAAVKQTVILRPANGNFDAVVVQSSPLDLFPEGRNLLTGRPVYTVYIAVGTAKDWALYFCIPGEKPPDAGAVPGIVVLSSPPPMRAPYPTRIVRPEISLPKYEKYVLLHAILSEKGTFRELRVVNAGAAQTDQAIVAAISGWEFRPASRDGVPVAVEILLAIPAAGL